jgi:hypothetical protein
LNFKDMGLTNKYLYQVAPIEFHGVLILLPYLFKEIVNG